MEPVLERFRVPFGAMRTGKGASHLQRNNLVFWFIEGRLDSVEVLTSAHHGLSDLLHWGGFDPFSGDLLGWCAAQGISLTLTQEEQLWNVTLALHA